MANLVQVVVDDDLAQYDEEEPEQRGNSTFKPPVEVLPKTKRTETVQKRRIAELIRRKQEAEDLRKKKEQEEAERRKQAGREQQRKELERKRKEEEERKKKEELEMRKKMEGGLEQLLDALAKNLSAPHITTCGIEMSSVRLRLLTQAMAPNTSCVSLDLNRKGLDDVDGVSLAEMLPHNSFMQKLECEGNNLGVRAAEAFGQALRKNTTLRCLNLESNNLTASGNDQKGIIELASALRENRSLRVLMLSKNGITAQAGEYFVKSVEANEMLTVVDLTGNDPSLSVDQLRRIDVAVKRNRERQSAIRRAERRERFALYNEEFKCRQHCMLVEARRLEVESHEERRLNRMKGRFDKWCEEIKKSEEDEKAKYQELMDEAVDRAEANRGKGKKKKKGK